MKLFILLLKYVYLFIIQSFYGNKQLRVFQIQHIEKLIQE